MLLFLLAKRFAPLCLLRSELCHLNSVPVEPPLRVLGRKWVLECFSSRDRMKMSPGEGVPHHPSGAICDCLELALIASQENKGRGDLCKKGRFQGWKVCVIEIDRIPPLAPQKCDVL